MAYLVHCKTVDHIAYISMENPPVNALSLPVRIALWRCLERFAEDPQAYCAVLHGIGRTFIAGADITEFDHEPEDPWLPELVQKIEDLDKPVIAAIHGSALGGGLEIALACHYRCALADAKVGFPEVTLGLLPGASGTQRLPRLTGVGKALDMMISGKPIGAREAMQHGIIDRIIDGDLLEGATEYAREIMQEQAPSRKISQLAVDTTNMDAEFFQQYRSSIANKTRGSFAPEQIIKCVEAATTLPYAEALAREAELFAACLQSEQSQALRHLFFAEREVTRVPGLPKDTPVRPIGMVAIIGAGTMGAGIAMNFLATGVPVHLLERDRATLDRGLENIRRNYQSAVDKGRMTAAAMEQCLGLLEGTTSYDDIREADLVIEAVFENMAVKKQVFSALDKICKPGAILATNTSALDINEIARVTSRPGDVIGLHFFAPANIMRLLEIVRAAQTSDQTIATAMHMARNIHKTGVLVGVCFGFVGNRMFLPYLREAELMMLEGVPAERIDQLACDWGMAMGPHAVTDLSGLDVFYRLNEEDHNKPDDPTYFHICNVLYEMGRYGQKTAAGIYKYSGRRPEADPEVARIARQEADRLGIAQREIGDEEVIERLLYSMINEGARILEEGIAQRPGDIDVIFTHGYGFPRYRGGPMFHAEQIGLPHVLEAMEKYRQRYGDRYWTPSHLLMQIAAEGGSFSSYANKRMSLTGNTLHQPSLAASMNSANA